MSVIKMPTVERIEPTSSSSGREFQAKLLSPLAELVATIGLGGMKHIQAHPGSIRAAAYRASRAAIYKDAAIHLGYGDDVAGMFQGFYASPIVGGDALLNEYLEMLAQEFRNTLFFGSASRGSAVFDEDGRQVGVWVYDGDVDVEMYWDDPSDVARIVRAYDPSLVSEIQAELIGGGE